MKNEADNIQVLNPLRAIAALSVCLYHFICTVVGFVDNEIVLSIFSYGHYGVQIFFVISGFIIPWSMHRAGYHIKNFFRFMFKRLVRLEPPYIVSLILAVTHTYFRAMSPHYNGVDITPTVKQVALHFGYLIPFFPDEHWIRPVYWTLAVEFQYYLFIALIFPLFYMKQIYVRITILSLFLVGPLLIHGNFLPHHMPIFLIGIILFMYKTKIIQKTELFIWLTAASISVVAFHTVASLCFSLFAFFTIFFFTDFKSRIGNFLGNISYSVYLFHSLTGMVILNYFAHTVHSPFLKFVLLIAALVVTIVASYIVYRLIEKPSKRLSSKIKY